MRSRRRGVGAQRKRERETSEGKYATVCAFLCDGIVIDLI